MKKLKQQTIEKEIPVFGELHKIKAIPLGLNVKIPVMLMLFIAALSFGQLTKSENYIDRKECLNGDCSQYSEAVTYFDGLGRAKQIIGVKASPTAKDVVAHIEYDQFGRPVKNYLPIPQNLTQSGGIYTAPLSAASTTYGVEKIYSESILENSPLGRIQKQFQRGNDWSTKPVNYSYSTNSSLDKVRKFTTITSWENGSTKSDLVENGIYSDTKLYKTTVTDEDGMPSTEFKNTKGQIILSRKGDNNDTYYVYNEYDQLAFVLSPLAGAATDIVSNLVKQDQLLYQYRYDKKNRLVEKKMPGKGWEYMVYDKGGRLVLSQDALLGSITNNFGKKGWLFTKYDELGRVAYTGFLADTSTRAVMQSTLNSMVTNPGNNEQRSSTSFTLNGMDVYYTKNAFPTGSMTTLGINYYDTYPPGAPSAPTQVFGYGVLQQPGLGNSSVASTKGLPLASYVKNIDDDRWTKDYSYYDTKGREISTVSVNYQGGYTKMEAELDFIGNPLRINTYHKRKSDEVGVTVKERFVYDDQRRIKQHYHQVDDMSEELLSDNTYNELSQLVNKKVGNNLQSIDYMYNIRGWLTGINKDQMALADLGGKLFTYKVKYNQKDGITNPDGVLFLGKNVTAKYNGNIAEADWRSVEIPGVYPSLTPKRYGYAYDSLNRLTAGFYQNPLNPYSKENTESLQYDLNGNITNLYRTSVMENGSTIATKIDDLAYTYDGNMAVKIKDNSGNSTGYEGTAGNAIGYDANGNITSMPDKQFSEIKYNILNLPALLSVNLGTMGTDISSLYSADGTKLNKTSVNIVYGYYTTTTTTEKTDYLDGFQYYKKDISTSGGDIGTELMMMSRAMEPQAFTPILADPTIDPVLGGGTIGNITLATPKTQDLQFFPTSEGFYDYQKNQYIYQYRDIYGNVRVSFGKNSAGALEILDNNDYYPYGMNHLKTGTSYFGQNSFKKYKFLGNELQETGMYDMNARFYMPDVGRFAQHDPLSDSTLDPYGYAFGNPINFIDPLGTSPVDWNETGTEFGYGGPGNPQAIGTTANPIDVGEIVLNAPIRPMAFNSNLPSCSYCYTGSGVRGGLQNMGILPRPLSHEEALRRINIPVLHNGSAQMMDSMWEVLGIVAANAKPENQEAALGLAAIAIITTKGKAAPAIIKAEVSAEKNLASGLVEDLVTVRHHTSTSAVNAIKKSGYINVSSPKPFGVDVEVAPFISPSKVSLGQAAGGKLGGGYIEFTVPKWGVTSTPYIGGKGNSGRIIVEGRMQLDIKTLNPKYVKRSWWPF